MRVFIVDDSPRTRARVRDTVKRVPGGEVVGEAGDAAAALAGVGRTQPDIVVLDVAFPCGGGRVVLDVIRRAAAPPAVLILTAHAEQEYRDYFLRHGAAGFFDKALEYERFAAALAALGGA